MKKGLIFALGTIMLLLAGNIGFANAPTFSQVPDIIIGDKDFNDANGATVDWNFFTYVNAFNVLDFASDNDSPVSSLRFVFKESPPDVDDDVAINEIKQIHAGDGEFSGDPSTWPGGKDLSGGGTNHMMSFRDIVRSPLGGTDPPAGPAFPNPTRIGGGEVTSPTLEMLPWHNDAAQPGVLALGTDGLKRVVTLYVADEATTASFSPTFAVFSLNNGEDNLSGGFTTVFFEGTTNWTYNSFGGFLGVATSSGGPGSFLGLESGALASTAQSNCFFARWETTKPDPLSLSARVPSIPANLIYLARFGLTPNVNSLGTGHPATKTDLNNIRLGVNSASNAFILDNLIATTNYYAGDVDGQLPALGVSRNYDMLWSSMANTPNFDELDLGVTGDLRTWQVYFDVADLNGNGAADEGLWRLETFTVGSIPRPPSLDVGSPSSVRFVLTDLTAANGFAYAYHQSNMNVLENNPSPGLITFDDLGRSGLDPSYGQFMAWQRLNTAPWLAGKVMRASVEMSCPTTPYRDNYHITRIRHGIELNNIVQTLFIRQAGLDPPAFNCPGMPAVAPATTTYEVYVPSWGGPTAYMLSVPALADLADWALNLDQIQNTGQANVNNATRVTFHQVLYEILDEPSVQ